MSVFFLFVLFVGCLPNPQSNRQDYQPPVEKREINENCVIPSSAQIVHFPMIHDEDKTLQEGKNVNEDQEDFLDYMASFSQFLLVHTLNANKDKKFHLFYEGYSITLKRGDISDRSYLDERIQTVSRFFNEGISNNYNDLSDVQQNVFLEHGGGFIALAAGIVNTLYRTSSEKESQIITDKVIELHRNSIQIKKERNEFIEEGGKILQSNEDKYNDKTKEFKENRKTLNYYIYDKREEIVKDEVQEFLTQEGKKNVFIAYGAAHDFQDEFKNQNFFSIPDKCAMHTRFLHHPKYAFILVSKADRLASQDDLTSSVENDIIDLYRRGRNILAAYLQDQEKELSGEEGDTDFWDSDRGQFYTYQEIKSIYEDIRESHDVAKRAE